MKHIVASVGSPSTKSIVPSRGQNKVPCEVITTTRSYSRTLRQVSSRNGSINMAREHLSSTMSDVAYGVSLVRTCCRRARQNTHTSCNKTISMFSSTVVYFYLFLDDDSHALIPLMQMCRCADVHMCMHHADGLHRSVSDIRSSYNSTTS